MHGARAITGWPNTRHFQKLKSTSGDNISDSGLAQKLQHILYDCQVHKPTNGPAGIDNIDSDPVNWLEKDVPLPFMIA